MLTKRKVFGGKTLFLILFFVSISSASLAHNIPVSGGTNWTYLGYHHNQINPASYKYYGTVDQWTKDRFSEGIGRWTSSTNHFSMTYSSFSSNQVKENNNLSTRANYVCQSLSGQHCNYWDMNFNRIQMQNDESAGSPRWRTISTFAHEIGHMVGLDHITTTASNLMYVPWTQRTVSYPGTGDMTGFNYMWAP